MVEGKSVEATGSKKNVGDLLIAIGEIFGDELVSSQKRDDNQTEVGNQIEKPDPNEQEGENVSVNSDGKLSCTHCCEICKKSFNKKIELKEHLFVHNGHFKFKVSGSHLLER